MPRQHNRWRETARSLRLICDRGKSRFELWYYGSGTVGAFGVVFVLQKWRMMWFRNISREKAKTQLYHEPKHFPQMDARHCEQKIVNCIVKSDILKNRTREAGHPPHPHKAGTANLKMRGYTNNTLPKLSTLHTLSIPCPHHNSTS